MLDFKVKEELESREITKKWFPNHFAGLTGSCFSNYDYSRFKSEYRKYLATYFNDEFNEEKRIGYDYLNLRYLRNNIMSDSGKTAVVFNQLWKQYLQLED